eukprot:TRINITY_DN9213_c0_g1_i22.p1 TRINITY_DN9213_c0_g1~~TRINITY_DN9213_c0_g1_i22.p1  ORF type:complete len:100 (+),score=15.00 TRINITY_DN9213_c0_g1_i22:698-997(+)
MVGLSETRFRDFIEKEISFLFIILGSGSRWFLVTPACPYTLGGLPVGRTSSGVPVRRNSTGECYYSGGLPVGSVISEDDFQWRGLPTFSVNIRQSAKKK